MRPRQAHGGKAEEAIIYDSKSSLLGRSTMIDVTCDNSFLRKKKYFYTTLLRIKPIAPLQRKSKKRLKIPEQ